MLVPFSRNQKKEAILEITHQRLTHSHAGALAERNNPFPSKQARESDAIAHALTHTHLRNRMTSQVHNAQHGAKKEKSKTRQQQSSKPDERNK